MVYHGAHKEPSAMVKKRGSGKRAKRKTDGMVRASSSYPRELYRMLEAIAGEKKVSIAWVMRDAAQRYVDERWPLFAKKEG